MRSPSPACPACPCALRDSWLLRACSACSLGCLLLGFPYPRAISESKEVPYWGVKLGQQDGAQPAQVLPSGFPGGQALH